MLSVYNSIDSVCVQTDYIHVTATRKHIHLAVIQLPLTIHISFQIHVASLTDWFILYIYMYTYCCIMLNMKWLQLCTYQVNPFHNSYMQNLLYAEFVQFMGSINKQLHYLIYCNSRFHFLVPSIKYEYFL